MVNEMAMTDFNPNLIYEYKESARYSFASALPRVEPGWCWSTSRDVWFPLASPLLPHTISPGFENSGLDIRRLDYSSLNHVRRKTGGRVVTTTGNGTLTDARIVLWSKLLFASVIPDTRETTSATEYHTLVEDSETERKKKQKSTKRKKTPNVRTFLCTKQKRSPQLVKSQWFFSLKFCHTQFCRHSNSNSSYWQK